MSIPRPAARHARCCSRYLKTGGRLFALFMQSGNSDGPPFSCELTTMPALFPADRWLWPTDHFTVEHPVGLTEVA